MRNFLSSLGLLIAFASSASAQEGLTGTIEQLDQDNGSVTISGRVLVFSESETEVFWQDRRIPSANIDPGMVVRYTLDELGTVRRIELIGPIDLVSRLDLH